MSAPIYKGGPPFNGAYFRFKNSIVYPLQGAGAPTNGTTGANVAGKGSVYIDNTTGTAYRNTGTKASPVWATGALSNSATTGIGYSTGAGGAVTQGTSRTTGVTLNTVCGAITLFTAAGSTTPATFTVTNSTVAATDVPVVVQKSGTDLYTISVTAVAAGSFNITFNTKSGTTSEAPVFNFAIIKAVAA